MSVFEQLADLERKGGVAVLATIVRTHGSVPRHAGSKMLIFPDGSIEGTIGGGEMEGQVIEEALAALADGRTRLHSYSFRGPGEGSVGVCGGEIEVFVEPIRTNPTLVVIGGGHVGAAVAHLADWLGFRIVISDDRPEFASPEVVPEADQVHLGPMAELPNHLEINENTYLVLTTRGVDVDAPGLPALLATPAAYIGVIGSRRRWETTAKELLAAGVSKQALERIHSPIGLELNAETPEEIAVSILSEIIMLRHGGTGEAMAHRSVKLED
ncbi:MAG: XdhC family protein [Anaerolineales bacterium]|jgi:xanthine dehydrogenase accessory factor